MWLGKAVRSEINKSLHLDGTSIEKCNFNKELPKVPEAKVATNGPTEQVKATEMVSRYLSDPPFLYCHLLNRRSHSRPLLLGSVTRTWNCMLIGSNKENKSSLYSYLTTT